MTLRDLVARGREVAETIRASRHVAVADVRSAIDELTMITDELERLAPAPDYHALRSPSRTAQAAQRWAP